VRVSANSNPFGTGSSSRISVRSGRTPGAWLGGGGTEPWPLVAPAADLGTVDICKVVVPSNDGGDTKVVFGTGLAANDSPVLIDSVTCVVAGERAIGCVSASSERFASRAKR